jgi:hypothetical protein
LALSFDSEKSMPKKPLEADYELGRMLSPEQRRALRLGGRAQRIEEAPAPPPSHEVMQAEFDEKRREQLRERDREIIRELIMELNRKFDVGGGQQDVRRGSIARHAA